MVNKKKLFATISTLATVLIVYFLVKSLIGSYNQVDWNVVELDFLYISLSLVLLVAGYLKLAYNWREIVLSMYENLELSKGIFYWCLSQFGKYIPGKVWFALGRVYLAGKEGISKKKIMHSIFVEIVLCIVVTLALGSVLLSGKVKEVNMYLIYSAVAVIALVMIHPKIFNFILGIIGKIVGKDLTIELHYGEILRLLINFGVAWVLIGGGFALFVKGIGIEEISILMLMGVFMISWVGGFLAIIVPSGIGVREGIMAALLSTDVGIGLGLVIAVIARLWWTIGELIALPISYALVFVVRKLKKKGVKNVPGNYFDKYNSKNPLVRLLMWLYFEGLFKMISKTNAKKILDVGCGEGHATSKVHDRFDVEIKGCDLEKEVIEKARKNYEGIVFGTGNIYELKEEDESYDLVIAGEVLEHLYEPEKAIKELKRVSSEYVIISVPCEPVWRMANMSRLRYIKALGNTPGHVQNFSKKEIRNLLRKHFGEVRTRSAGLWTIVLCKK
jgi:ubiquinone/menaquinone biosynthesis C-methylase UbiE